MLVSLQLAAVIFFVVWAMKADPNKGCAVQLCVGESSREPITARGFGTPPAFSARVCFGSSMRVLPWTLPGMTVFYCFTHRSRRKNTGLMNHRASQPFYPLYRVHRLFVSGSAFPRLRFKI
jgi:hypothetical protein